MLVSLKESAKGSRRTVFIVPACISHRSQMTDQTRPQHRKWD
jgi:hypothetical protein